jgi:hypothetical protein
MKADDLVLPLCAYYENSFAAVTACIDIFSHGGAAAAAG